MLLPFVSTLKGLKRGFVALNATSHPGSIGSFIGCSFSLMCYLGLLVVAVSVEVLVNFVQQLRQLVLHDQVPFTSCPRSR